jgi:Na+/alanine symporter
MGPGGIATIIAASALMVIAIAVAYFIIRASRILDELQETIASVNRIATTAENFTEKIGGLVTNLTSMNSGIFKLISSISSFVPGRKSSATHPKEHE